MKKAQAPEPEPMSEEEWEKKRDDLEDALGIVGTIDHEETSSFQREELWSILEGPTRKTLSVTPINIVKSEQTWAVFSEKPLSADDVKMWQELMNTDYE